jgi:hemoglobin
MAQTMYERYGGFPKIRRVVSDFYDRVLEEPELQRHFEGVDMRRLVDHQTKFVADG